MGDELLKQLCQDWETAIASSRGRGVKDTLPLFWTAFDRFEAQPDPLALSTAVLDEMMGQLSGVAELLYRDYLDWPVARRLFSRSLQIARKLREREPEHPPRAAKVWQLADLLGEVLLLGKRWVEADSSISEGLVELDRIVENGWLPELPWRYRHIGALGKRIAARLGEGQPGSDLRGANADVAQMATLLDDEQTSPSSADPEYAVYWVATTLRRLVQFDLDKELSLIMAVRRCDGTAWAPATQAAEQTQFYRRNSGFWGAAERARAMVELTQGDDQGALRALVRSMQTGGVEPAERMLVALGFDFREPETTPEHILEKLSLAVGATVEAQGQRLAPQAYTLLRSRVTETLSPTGLVQALVACLLRSPECRAQAVGDTELLHIIRLNQDAEPAMWLRHTCELVTDEEIVVLEPTAGVGYRVWVNDITQVNDLWLLLAQALLPMGKQPPPDVIRALRSPMNHNDVGSRPYRVPYSLASARLLEPDGTLPEKNLQNPHLLGRHDTLSSLTRLDGVRHVIWVPWAPIWMLHGFRSYEYLQPAVEVRDVLAADEVQRRCVALVTPSPT